MLPLTLRLALPAVCAAVAVALVGVILTRGGAAAPEPRPPDTGRPFAQSSAEAELAAAYVPVMYVREQSGECDRDGEAYVPMDVDFLFDNAEIELRRNVQGRPVEIAGPTASDVFGKDRDYYLDFPGNPRKPGCTYERDFRRFAGDAPAVTYAHVQAEDGVPGRLALQYWFFYYYNDWNNLHEGDWEMIQVSFDANSTEEALQEDPVRVAYAQHGGGEIADWDDRKLQKEDGRPVVYPAAGSHATYYENGVYLGIAQGGTGFGCDDASDPHRRVDLEVRLLPDEVIARDEYAWLDFGGRWGEEAGHEYSGPTGPKQKSKWLEPFDWEDNLRDVSEKLPEGETLGFDPLKPICVIIGAGSVLLNAFIQQPFAVGGGAATVFLIGLGVLMAGVPRRIFGLPAGYEAPPEQLRGSEIAIRRSRDLGQIGRATAVIYFRHLILFLALGAVFIGLGLIATSFDAPFEISDYVDSPLAEPLLTLTVGSLEAVVAFLIVEAAITAALGELQAGGRPSFRSAYRVVWGRLVSLVGARLRATAHVLLLLVSVVGSPWAVHRSVAWFFTEQMVILEGRAAKPALAASADLTRGSWGRTLGMILAAAAIVVVPGPLIGIGFLLAADPPVSDTVYAVNAVLYSTLLLPIVAIAKVLLYYDLKYRAESRDESSRVPSP